MKYLVYIYLLLLTITTLYAKTTITANSTYVRYGKDNYLFEGNVRVDSPTLSLFSDTVEYTKEYLSARGNISFFLKEDNVKIYSDYLYRSENNTHFFMKDGRVKVEDKKNNRNIDAKEIYIYGNDQKYKDIFFQGEPVLIQKNMKVTAEKEMVYEQKTDQVHFIGKTSIEDLDNKDKIQSENIVFFNQTQKLLFNTSVNITNEKSQYLSASKGDYDMNSKYLNLDDNVQYISESTQIQSDILRTDESIDFQTQKKTKVQYFEKNIDILYQSFKGTSRQIMVDQEHNYTELIDGVFLKKTENDLEITCDLMDIFEQDKKSYLYGNVILKTEDKTFFGDVAVYDDKTKIFTIRGNTKYIESGNEYTSQVIYLNSQDLSVKFIGQVMGSSTLENLKGIKVDKGEEEK